MRESKIRKREREVETKNLPSNGERKCLPTKTKRKTKIGNLRKSEIGKGMRKTKMKTEIGKRERNEENKNRKERERSKRKTYLPTENGNASQRKCRPKRKRESRGERKRESWGESVTNITYHYYQCNLSYHYHSNAYKLMYISYHSNSEG